MTSRPVSPGRPLSPQTSPRGFQQAPAELQFTALRNERVSNAPAPPPPQPARSQQVPHGLLRGPALYTPVSTPRALRLAGSTTEIPLALSVFGAAPSRAGTGISTFPFDRPNTYDERRPVGTPMSDTDSLLPLSRNGMRPKLGETGADSRLSNQRQQQQQPQTPPRTPPQEPEVPGVPPAGVAAVNDSAPRVTEAARPPTSPPPAEASAARRLSSQRRRSAARRANMVAKGLTELPFPTNDARDIGEGSDIGEPPPGADGEGAPIAIVEWNEPAPAKQKPTAFGRSSLPSLYPVRLDSPSRRAPDDGPKARGLPATADPLSATFDHAQHCRMFASLILVGTIKAENAFSAHLGSSRSTVPP